MKKEISKLDEFEIELDKHKTWVEQSIKNITEDIEAKKMLYVTHNDLRKCFCDDDSVVILNCPVGATTIKFQVKLLIILNKTVSHNLFSEYRSISSENKILFKFNVCSFVEL